MNHLNTKLLPIVVCSKNSEIYRINSELGEAKVPMYLLINQGSEVDEFPFTAAIENNLVNCYEEGRLPVIIIDSSLGRETGGQVMSAIMERFPQGGLFLRIQYADKPMFDAWNRYLDKFDEKEIPNWGFEYFAGPTIREICDEFLLERSCVEDLELENIR